MKRLNKYMNLPELSEQRENIVQNETVDHAVKITKASFKWNSTDEVSNLKDIDVEIKKKSLVAVVGTVGSGKSSLINAILGKESSHSNFLKKITTKN